MKYVNWLDFVNGGHPKMTVVSCTFLRRYVVVGFCLSGKMMSGISVGRTASEGSWEELRLNGLR